MDDIEPSKLGKIYEEGHAAPFPCTLFFQPWALKLRDKAGEDMKTNAAVFRDGGIESYTEPEEQTRVAKKLLRRMMDEGLFEKVRDNTARLLDDMLAYIDVLEAADYRKKNDVELAEVYRQYCNRLLELNSWGTLVTLMEMGHESVITGAAFDYLKKKGAEAGLEGRVPEALSVLATPVQGTFLREKKIGVLRAALAAKDKGLQALEVREAIDSLHEKYSWVSYGYTGPALSRSHFAEEVAALSGKSAVELGKELDAALHEDAHTKKRQETLEKSFKMDAHGKRLFEMARTFAFQKEYRKQVLYKSFRAIEPMRAELAAREGCSVEESAFILPNEVTDLLGGKIAVQTLRERMRLCVHLPFQRKLLTGRQAEEFVAKLSRAEHAEDARELRGQPAYIAPPVKGTARLVFNAHDLGKLEAGDVLVSPATSPVMVPAMKKAAAIVTDQGGLTCHAAIVSRELRKPCVIGTKIATKALKDGDLVEVDAANGIVRKLS